MKNCAFTIVAKNYIGLALILESSIRKYYGDLSFYIIVADEVSEDLRSKLPANVLIAKECLGLDVGTWHEMSFKYNLTEFCTSIKPASFLYLFENTNFDKIIYLDPDIYFYSSIGQIFKMLDECNILLTPHITQILDKGLSDSPENIWHSCGMYNLGFCGLKRSASALQMLKWWHARLRNDCYIDSYNFLYTDQKWMDFLPSFFSPQELKISFNLGMNTAPWNFYEREIFEEDNQLYVRSRCNKDRKDRVIFVHYSGYDYKELKKGGTVQKNILNIKKYSDIEKILFMYGKAIIENVKFFDCFISLQYSYGFYSNGNVVTSVHRRLYRSMVSKGMKDDNPFLINGVFYSLLAKKKLIVTTKSNLDKLTKQNFPNAEKKLKYFNLFMKMLFSILGYERYFLLIRLLHPYSRLESQIHLLDDKYLDNNIY